MQSTHARKRLTRREIKEDKLLIFTSRTSLFLEEHLWHAVAALGALVVVIVGYYVYTGWHERQTERGMEEITGLALLADAQQHDQVIVKADQIVNSYVGRPDLLARLYKADALRDKREFAAAKQIYKDWRGDSDDEVNSFHAARGFADCLAAEQQFSRAGEVMLAWADDHEDSGIAAYALMAAATHFELANRYVEARDALKRILDTYGDTQLVGKARQRYRMMEGAAKIAGERG